MSMELTRPFAPVNNDRMAAFTAFRAAPTSTPVESTVSESVAAVALPATPAPRTTRLDDTQADGILGAMQQEDEQEMLQAHSGLDADRVARLLSLLS